MSKSQSRKQGWGMEAERLVDLATQRLPHGISQIRFHPTAEGKGLLPNHPGGLADQDSGSLF